MLVLALALSIIRVGSAAGSDHLLWIGDSHSGLNRMSARYFEIAPRSTSWFSVSGANARHWWSGNFRGLRYGALRFLPGLGDRAPIATSAPNPAWSFDDLVKSEKPTHVVFALGTNDAVNDCRSPITTESYPVRLAARARALGLRCLWVAPTSQNWDASSVAMNNLVKACGEVRYRAWIQALHHAVQAEGCIFFDSSRVQISKRVQPSRFADCLAPKSDPWLPDDREKLHFRSARAYAQWTSCLLLSREWSRFLSRD